MIENIIAAAVGSAAGISALWLLLLLPRMWKEQKKINALLWQMREDNSND